MWSRFLLCFDLKLSAHSLIHYDRSRLTEQTRALVGILQSSVGQLHRNSIHMFYPRDVRGEGGNSNHASKPPTPPLFAVQWPSTDGAGPVRFDTGCLSVVINVLGVQLKCALGGPQYENDLCFSGADPTRSVLFGAQWAGIQVKVIAGWIWDRRLGQMRIRPLISTLIRRPRSFDGTGTMIGGD